MKKASDNLIKFSSRCGVDLGSKTVSEILEQDDASEQPNTVSSKMSHDESSIMSHYFSFWTFKSKLFAEIDIENDFNLDIYSNGVLWPCLWFITGRYTYS